jgi:hypothetical protein
MSAKPDRKRGRHKKRVSLETREWEAKHLPPARPAWMDAETWRELVALRKQLDVLA